MEIISNFLKQGKKKALTIMKKREYLRISGTVLSVEASSLKIITTIYVHDPSLHNTDM